VAEALARDGLLLVQGQAEIASVADLLAGRPITTRGYSWDYAPAWNLTDEYERDRDVAVVKLFRGRRTLVQRRLWPAVDALAVAARVNAYARDDLDPFLAIVERSPGIPLGELRTELGLERRVFDRPKRTLESWLCVFGRERDDVDFHTHEPALFPWSEGKIARGTRKRPAPGDALDALALAAGTSTPARLFPVVRAYSGS
jgi:hypothetical protein